MTSNGCAAIVYFDNEPSVIPQKSGVLQVVSRVVIELSET